MELTDKIAGTIIIVAGMISLLFGLIMGPAKGGFIFLLFGATIILSGIYFLINARRNSGKQRKQSKPEIKPKSIEHPKYQISIPVRQQIKQQIIDIKKAISSPKISSKTANTTSRKLSDIEKIKQEALRKIKHVHKRSN